MLVQITSFYEICVHYNDDTKRLAGATEETPEYYRYLDEWYRFLIKLINMNENIDLTKILKNCPIGTKLYSTIYGEVEFYKIVESNFYPIVLRAGNSSRQCVTKYGMHSIDYENKGECTLFPSKDQRDWSKFTAPWYKKGRFDPKTLQPFDRVIASNYCDDEWDCDIFSHINQEYSFPYVCIGQAWKCCIPYNDDTKHLVGTTDEAPDYYRYWED